MSALLIAALALPAAAAIASLVAPPASRVAGWLAVVAAAIAAGCLALVPAGATVSTTWLAIGDLELELGLRGDGLARTVALLVAAVSALVDLYAIAHLADDERRARFFAWMSLFTAAMLALVLADSLLVLFAGWEGVGLASYGLIAFHHRDREARRAADRAFLVTRAGDLCLLLALGLVLVRVGSVQIDAIAAASDGALAGTTGLLVAVLVLGAAIAKSAQLPLSAWLPAAMVAPTPVSALLHSATMVAAGVYLVARLWPLFEVQLVARDLLLAVGSVTALAAALRATAAADLKRLLAWSTISHLGLMMMALGLGSPTAALFHLVVHAAFKAALFVVAGAVDQRAGSRQLAELGGLASAAPGLALGFAAAGLALGGLPPLGGFWSDEGILGAAAARGPGWAALVVAEIFVAGVYIARAGVAVFARWRGAPSPEVGPARPLVLQAVAPLALVAAGGYFLQGPIEGALPFPPPPSPAAAWTVAAIAASVAGLGLGALRCWRRGPVPALGLRLGWIDELLVAALDLPARATVRLARTAGAAIEATADRVARALAAAAATAAAALRPAERALDTAADDAARASVTLARAVVTFEREGVAAPIDAGARSLDRAGALLRRTQSGRIHVYAAGLFVWALVAGVLSIVIGI